MKNYTSKIDIIFTKEEIKFLDAKKTNICYKVHRNKLNRVIERIKSLKLH